MKIISTAPSRISLFGGGTDVAPFVTEYGGIVLNFAINLRTHLTFLTDDEKWEYTDNFFPQNANPQLAYTILTHYGIGSMHHVRFVSTFDGTIGAGLGSSASFAVALISAIHKYQGFDIEPMEIAEIAWDMEVNKLGWHGGKQDQYAIALGGGNYLDMKNDVWNLPVAKEYIDELMNHLVLYYVGGKREEKIQDRLKDLTKNRISQLTRMKKIAGRGLGYLIAGNMQKIGELLDESWELKKKANKVSNEKIDKIYTYAKESGAWGGKLLGAGGGGYMIFMVDLNKKTDFLEKMEKRGYLAIDFSPDWQGIDVRIV